MAKLERTLTGNFDQILDKIEEGIKGSSVSASMEGWSDFREGSSRCSVRVFERYSYAGGSTALFYKLNTLGEETFLNKLKEIL